MAIAENMPSQLQPGISWNLSYCDFDDNKFFCEWEAPAMTTVEQVFRSTQLPYDTILPVFP
ncbi:nickel-binding protein [Chloroflexota bacterium]